MPLDPKALQDNLLEAFKEASKITDPIPGCPPNVPPQVADLFAGAYGNYAQGVLQGVLTFVVPPVQQTLSSALTAPMLAGWAPGLTAFWAPVIWAGPGLIPANPIDPTSLAGLAALVSPQIVSLMTRPSNLMPKTLKDSASEISRILHSATLSLRVLTTTVPPATVIAPVPFA